MYRPGLDVVGYTGFVPGKNAGNIFGQTYSQSNYSSQKQYKPVSERQRKYVADTLNRYHGMQPSSEHGNYEMYKNLYR
jgi:hypothetical protein